MKRVILCGLMMLITFALGTGLNELLWHRPQADPLSTAKIEYRNCGNAKPEVESVRAATLVATPSSTSECRIILDYNYKTFDPSGLYFFMGSAPKEFAEIISFEFGWGEMINDQPTGFISVQTRTDKDWDNYQAIFGLVSERQFFFVTGPGRNSDFEYRFDGEFVRRDFEAVSGKRKAVLRGTLTKMKQGRKIAERVVSFWIETHFC